MATNWFIYLLALADLHSLTFKLINPKNSQLAGMVSYLLINF